MSSEENKALVRRFYEEVWNRGNVTAVDELIAPNYVNHFDFPANVPVPADSPLNREALKQFIPQFRGTFPDLHIMVEFQVAEGDLVVTRMTARGTHQGEYRGLTFKGNPPTGRQATWTMTDINRIRDGKIVEGWFNEDAVGRLQQIGVLPTPGQAS